MSTEPIALPPLPESHRKGITGRSFFDSDQMRAYALSAVAALQAQVTALEADAQRSLEERIAMAVDQAPLEEDKAMLDWLEANCTEEHWDAKAFSGEFPDARLKHKLPPMISTTCVNGSVSLREAIRRASAAQEG